MKESDGINQIFNMFKRDDIKKDSKLFAALYNENNEKYKEYAKYALQKLALNKDIKKLAKLGLKCLAQNQANLAEIRKDWFIIPDD
ncbi:MAG: hypothetical protein EZS28_009396 [Streblomastix strix]|uniref:Uncharacterized protein n=1 Tax=Streblomastix strix TaxID=222440 RepID=A0A5J4WJ14_9EUKA|nr:MAG: hypothetical protein EZS28_009396 [Streblomastix strix]